MLCTSLLLLTVSVAVLSQLSTAQDSTVVPSKDDRPPSMFKVGDEWLALPDVFSVLDFAADSTPAPDHDLDAQLRLRSTRFWGRLYIDGWPQTIQFFRAHFGIEPPIGRKRFIFPEPRDACGEITNANLITSEHVLLVHRGECTFGQKAKNAATTKAAAIVIINNEPGLDHLPGPDAHDIQFSVSSIAQQEGQLLEALYDDGPAEDGLGRRIEGYMVPINCVKSGAKCGPATVEEREAIKNLAEGGTLLLNQGNEKLEYLLAHYGTQVSHESVNLPLVIAKPVEACAPLENNVKGKAVLVRRGSCPFVKKAEEIQAAGGKAMIVGNNAAYLVRMGVEPRWKGLNTAIPVVMVSKKSYSTLVAESYSGGTIAFQQDNAVNKTINSETWEPLEKLHKGEGWPRSEAFVQKRYDELVRAHADWPDRLETLKEALQTRLKAADSSVNKASSIKSDL